MSYPKPIFNWLANGKQLKAPMSFARASIGSRFDSSGVLRYNSPGAPRFNYDPLTGVCKGLMIESAAIFQDAFSQQFDNAAWTKVGASVSPNAAISPDGLMTADKLVEDASIGNTHGMSSAYNFVSGTYYVVLAFVKACERTSLGIAYPSAPFGASVRYDFTLSGSGAAALITNGSGNSANIIPAGCGWYIVSVKAQATTTTSGSVTILLKNDSSASYDGDGVSGIYLWEAKVYAGSFPVSTLPTGWETASETSNSIGTGSKTFSVGNNSIFAGKAIPPGATVRVWQTSNPANYMIGTVTSHAGTSLVLNITASGGSGTGVVDWTIQAGSSVTRAGEACIIDLNKLTDSGNRIWSGAEGTIVIRGTAPVGVSALNQSLFSIDDNSMSNRIIAYRDPATRFVYVLVYVNGIIVATLHTGVLADSTDFSIAISFNSANCIVALNGGVPITTQLSAIPQDATIFRLGCNAVSMGQFDGLFSLLQIYNRYVDAARISMLSIL